jgi:sterol desaturase/sphingolipid hydroxylase (fatty acid hydroxylase superfamily)
MSTYPLIIAAIYLAFAGMELATGRFFQKMARTGDGLVEALSSTLVPVVIVPAMLVAVHATLASLWPSSTNSLAGLPWWGMVGLFLLFDDLPQYWWHRLSHSVPALYAFHRAHHEARYMSVRLMYRNNLLYYATMPGGWLSAVLVHMGGGPVYAAYAVVKGAVIAGAHSSVPWDAPLHRYRALHPVAWVLERLISTPCTHAAHHGLNEADGATHHRGNYGNLLYIWDVIFGTARITRRRPAGYGIERLPPATWTQQLFHPFLPVPSDANAPS